MEKYTFFIRSFLFKWCSSVRNSSIILQSSKMVILLALNSSKLCRLYHAFMLEMSSQIRVHQFLKNYNFGLLTNLFHKYLNFREYIYDTVLFLLADWSWCLHLRSKFSKKDAKYYYKMIRWVISYHPNW